MWSKRAAMFRKTCELIAEDRRAVERDYAYHRYLVWMMDECAKDLVAAMKKIGRVLDAHLGSESNG
jgi:hypothetical protein